MISRADTLLDRVSRRASEQARAEARTTVAMLEFADARRAEYEASGDSPYRDLELSSIAHELAVELQLSVRSVQNRLHAARLVRGRAPSAWSAFLTGRIDSYRVSIISAALIELRDPRSDGVVDERV
ncbi:MAG: HNH endonuclease signature motif containing protein, partial [Actinomycetes bacterium]